ncbi:hypothetical protein FKM82_001541 [Ascaphus truei]
MHADDLVHRDLLSYSPAPVSTSAALPVVLRCWELDQSLVKASTGAVVPQPLGLKSPDRDCSKSKATLGRGQLTAFIRASYTRLEVECEPPEMSYFTADRIGVQ